MYNVYVNDTKVKSYKYKLQAVIYCYLNNYVYGGGYGSRRFYTLDSKVKIVREYE